VWDSECPSSDPLEIWQSKIILLSRKIKGWKRNAEAAMKKSKNQLIEEMDLLDRLAKH
jgi:hypothetical protein